MIINVNPYAVARLRKALDDECVPYVLKPSQTQLNVSFGFVFELKGYVKLEITNRCWSLYANNRLIITLPNCDNVNCLSAW